MKRFNHLLAAAVTVFSMTLSGCALFPEEEALAPPLKAPAAVTYKTTTVERGTIVDSVSVSGKFISTRVYDLSFDKRSGYLSDIRVKAGDLVEKGQLLAKLDTDALELDIRKQELAVERAKIALDETKKTEGATVGAIRLAEIEYELQNLQLKNLKTELEKQSIYAPDNGVVSYVAKVSVGEYINSRSTLIQIVDPGTLQVECTGEKVFGMHLNQDVMVTINNKEYAGKVVATLADAPELAHEVGEAFIRVEVTNPPEEELLGKSVAVELLHEQKEDVLIIPRNVVSQYSGESYVLVLEDGVKKERMIETGIKNVTEIEVINGLEEGEVIIMK